MAVTSPSTEIDQALARSALYGLLARAFAYPEQDHRDVIRQLAAGLEALPPALHAEAVVLAASLPAPAEGEEAYARLFTHSSSRDCPAFETAYTAHEIFQQAQQMADIAGFYAAFGVQAAPGADRPDHITGELEFMQLLTAKERYAGQHLGVARVRQCRRAERVFLSEHLGCWGPTFGRRLAALDPDGWYGRAGRLLARWLEHECLALNAVPAAVIDAPLLAWPEPDNGECGLDEAGQVDECAGCAFTTSPPSPLPLRGGGTTGIDRAPGSPFPAGHSAGSERSEGGSRRPPKGAGGLGLPVLNR